jgi:segregation and condensation protein A
LADYRVNLEIFAGPLDLLLYLVRKEEVDIYDIPIAKITDQYIHYIEMLKSLDVDLAGDFLVMAATLMQIKSAMLLPRAEPDQLGQDQQDDPRTELIRQLLEYKKFKDAANRLNAVADEHKERFPRPGTIITQLQPNAEPEIDLEQVSLWDLLEAFDTICKAIGDGTNIRLIPDDTPIDLYQIEILHRLQTEGPLTFERIFESRTERIVMVGLFLALLELIREKLVWVEQPIPSSIYVRALTDEPAEQVVQAAILNVDTKDTESTKSSPQNQPPIAISELPPKSDSETSTEKEQKEQTDPISEPILESTESVD